MGPPCVTQLPVCHTAGAGWSTRPTSPTCPHRLSAAATPRGGMDPTRNGCSKAPAWGPPPNEPASLRSMWPSTTKPERRLTRTCWTQPTESNAPASASCCAFGWIRQLAGLARSWSGASSPDPLIRLRHAVAGLGAVVLVAMRRLIARREPTWAPTGQPGRVPDRRPGQFAKLGRVHTVARRGQRASAHPYGLPRPRSTHPSSSCTIGTAPRCS